MDIVNKAENMARQAHAGQLRKTDGSDYIAHPLAVAALLQKHGFGDEVVAAGLVHDVVEDSDLEIDDIREKLGEKVAQIVSAVSEDKRLEWEERKQEYARHLSQADEGVKAVSVADKVHNLTDLIKTHKTMGPAIWNKFNRGKDKKLWFEKLVLAELKKNWEHPLLDKYEKLVGEMEGLE